MNKKLLLQPVHPETKLGLYYVLNLLERDGLITREQNNSLLEDVKVSKTKAAMHPLITIADQDWQANTNPSYLLNTEVLTKWLAEKVDQPYFRIDPLKIDVQKITSIVTQAYASKLKILPVLVTDTEVTVASCEPFISSWENELSHIAERKIKRVMTNPESLEEHLVKFYGISKSITGAVNAASQKDSALSSVQNFEQLVSTGKETDFDTNDSHTVSIVDWLLKLAFEQRASDIHLEPRREKGTVRFRIDGVLQTVHKVPTILMAAVIARLKSLGRMNIADRRRPQDGRIKTIDNEDKEVEMRLSTIPTAFGEKLVIRLFNSGMLVHSYKTLGFSDHDEKLLKAMIDCPYGIILAVGPTGSGKTTTLYSLLNRVSTPGVNVCTIEDPIEMVMEQFNQTQVQPNIDLSFATGIRTLLRQDPDIIMIGEIRDQETANIAIQAALTGHVVLSSLHTNDAPSAITRLIDIGTEAFLLNATIQGIVSQRLVRTLCAECKQKTKLNKKLWGEFISTDKVAAPTHIYKPVGCDGCRNSGYSGRVGIYELLKMSTALSSHINPNTDLVSLREAAIAAGMLPLKISGAQKVAQGLTTMEEVYAVMPK